MQTKRIKCPKCGVVLDVKNSKNESVKLITCPSCHTSLQVKFPPQQAPMEAQTFYAGPTSSSSSVDGETQLAGDFTGATKLYNPKAIHRLKPKLLFGGVSYSLEEGRNIIGRKCSSSEASVQIDTGDRYMSRQHCDITVTSLPDGSMKAVLSNYQNKNQTTIDGQLLDEGDQVRLTDGNSITMGHTTVTFKLS